MKWIGQHIYDLTSTFRNTATFRKAVTMDTTLEVDGNLTLGSNLTFDSTSLTALQTSAGTFADNDTSIMTSAAIQDKIATQVEAYGYSTTTGDITGVTITTDSGGGSAASDTAGSADFRILGTSGVGVTNSSTTITVTSVPGEIDHDSLLNFASNEHFTQANITTVGTIDTGVWNGTVIASAYLDSDTAHLSGAQTVTGVKTIGTDVKLQFRDANSYINSPEANDIEIAATDITLDAAGIIKLEGPVRPTGQLQFTYHNFTADIDTTKTYLGLTDADSEGTSTTAIDLPFTAPLAGKLMRVYLKANKNLTTHTLTWRLETQAAGVTFGTGPSVVGTQSGAGCNTTTMTTYDFTSSLDSGDNVIDVGDSVYLSIQDDTATANTKWYVTCLWEWDLSSIG